MNQPQVYTCVVLLPLSPIFMNMANSSKWAACFTPDPFPHGPSGAILCEWREWSNHVDPVQVGGPAFHY